MCVYIESLSHTEMGMSFKFSFSIVSDALRCCI